MTIRIALGAALVLAASVPARAAARFLVGASAADITPPLAATAASNPADCDASGLYNGAHLFSLEEPYYKKVYVNGVEQPQAPNGSEQGNQVKTRRAKVVRSRPARRPVTGVIDRGRDSLLGADFQPDDWRSSMSDGAMQRLRFGRLLVLACATAFLGLVPLASGVQAPECLIEVNDQSGAVADNGTVCAVAPAGSKFCTINLELCHNVGTCSAGPLKGKARTTGHCNPGKLKGVVHGLVVRGVHGR